MDYTRIRLIIDIDPTGEIAQTSYEVKELGKTLAVHVMPAAGPFDTPAAMIAVLLADVVDRYGLRLRMF